MKVVQVTPVYPPYGGGIGSIAYEFTERLRARDIDVHVTTPAYKKRENTKDPDYIHRIAPLIEWGNAGFIPRLHKLLSQYDVIHLHYPFFGGAEVVAFDKLIDPKTPLVISYHHDVVASGLKGMFFAAHRRALMPGIMKRADRVLVSSLDYAKASDLRLAMDDTRIVELPFGVDTNRFSKGNSTKTREKFNIPLHEPVILFVGGLDEAHYFKGVDILLDALEEIKDVPWHAIIVGKGNRVEQYKAMSRVTGAGERIHFAQNVPFDELPDYYRAANVHVLPSTDKSEAFGIVTIEAAASGIPSIVSDLPGVRTVVANEETGFTFPVRDVTSFAEKLRTLVTNSTLSERMGEAARRRVEKEYSWPLIIDRLEGIYRSVAKRL